MCGLRRAGEIYLAPTTFDRVPAEAVVGAVLQRWANADAVGGEIYLASIRE